MRGGRNTLAIVRKPSPLYVETLIRAPLAAVWTETQDPTRHQTWDLRFSEIRYLPKAAPEEPQRFVYATRIGLGLRVEGRGESVVTRMGESGERTSVLRFWSEDPKSLIEDGGGYWRYLPEEDGVRFLTFYSYRTRGGVVGEWIDRLMFRPLLGWATACSFDCLRIALETHVPPRRLWTQLAAAVTLRVTHASIWIYQGTVPKLVFPATGELEILRGTGFFGGREPMVLTLMGVGEIGVGVILLYRIKSTRVLVGVALLLMALLAGAGSGQPGVLTAPFNPVSLTAAMLGLIGAELWLRRDLLPDAARCRRVPSVDPLPLS